MAPASEPGFVSGAPVRRHQQRSTMSTSQLSEAPKKVRPTASPIFPWPTSAGEKSTWPKWKCPA